MDINNLLKGIDCTCGKAHKCDIDYVYIEKNATERLFDICRKISSVLVVADGCEKHRLRKKFNFFQKRSCN